MPGLGCMGDSSAADLIRCTMLSTSGVILPVLQSSAPQMSRYPPAHTSGSTDARQLLPPWLPLGSLWWHRQDQAGTIWSNGCAQAGGSLYLPLPRFKGPVQLLLQLQCLCGKPSIHHLCKPHLKDTHPGTHRKEAKEELMYI